MKRLFTTSVGVRALARLSALFLASAVQAAPILTPSTTTYGGIVSGANFVTGGSTTVFSPPSNGWPSVQGPTKAVDSLIGPGSKYLNLNITNTALLFSGTTARVAGRLELWVAEDAVDRDPASYTLYGTNNLVPNISASGSTFALSNFTQIASGTLALPDARDTTADGFGYSQSVPIPGSTAYASYLLVFPTVKNAPTAANSMQISEVQLHADGINAVESSDFSNTGPGPSFFLEPGINRISGTLFTPSDGQDRFNVIVPFGTRLVSVSDNNAFNNGSSTFPLSAGTYPVIFSTNFAPALAPWFFNLTVESLPSTLPIIGVEQFDYPDGPIAAKNGGTFWDYKNFAPTAHTGTASTWDNVTAAPAIASGRLVTHNSSAKRTYNGTLESDGAVNDPASTPSSVAKSVYYRVTVTTGATVPTEFGLSSYDFGTEKIFFGKRAVGNNFLVEETGVGQSGASTTVLPNTTYTLVAMVDYLANTVRLYLNPDLNAPESTQPPVATLPYTGTNWSTAVRLASSGGSPVVWDNLVVATAWDVLGTVVTTTVDEDNLSPRGGGNGVSLREAVKYAPAGGLITFAPGLSGQTITLTHADGDMEIPQAVTIDASALPGGLTVSGNNTSRHFYLDDGKSLTLRGLTITGGNGTGAGTDNNFGGAIRNNGTLTLTQCTLSGNSASSSGGAILNDGPLMLTQCTFSGNSAGDGGGAIFNPSSSLTLTHCTLSGNFASNSGGAIFTYTPGTVSLTNSIVAGNAASNGPDITTLSGTITTTGVNLIGNLAGSGLSASANVLVADPKLSPLGYFGGPVQTMHPLIGSPAIDAAGTTDPGGTDARGFPRFVDGNASNTAQLDIGAVEASPRVRTSLIPHHPVTTAIDEDNTAVSGSGTGNSLREVLKYASMGSIITFDPSLAGQTITLSLGQLEIPTDRFIFIDASNLSAPVTVSGNNASRVFNIPATATVAMHSVRIVNGKAADGTTDGNPGANGGGIFNEGSLSLFNCALTGNAAGNGDSGSGGQDAGGGGSGGGIFSSGSLSLAACTLSGNATGSGGNGNGSSSGAGGSGGGIFSSGSLRLTACTLSGNATGSGGSDGFSNVRGGGSGGGIFQQGAISCRLTACTVVGNQTGNGGYGDNGENIGSTGIGGGISGGNAILENCLIALNTQGTGTADDVNVTTITYLGANLLSVNATGTGTSPALIINPNPLLAPLGDYGGPTQTMALRPGSPARNAATGSTRTTDQRGFPMVGVPDIGAYEAGTLSGVNLATTLAETLPGTGPASSVTPAADFDGDGQSNTAEITAGTLPADATSLLRITALSPSGGDLLLFFTSVAGKTYTLWRNDTLTGTWVNTGLSSTEAFSGIRFFTIPSPVNVIPKRFYRVQVGP